MQPLLVCGGGSRGLRNKKVHVSTRPAGGCGRGKRGNASGGGRLPPPLSDRKVQGRQRERSRLYLSKFRLYLAFFTSGNMVIVCMEAS